MLKAVLKGLLFFTGKAKLVIENERLGRRVDSLTQLNLSKWRKIADLKAKNNQLKASLKKYEKYARDAKQWTVSLQTEN